LPASAACQVFTAEVRLVAAGAPFLAVLRAGAREAVFGLGRGGLPAASLGATASSSAPVAIRRKRAVTRRTPLLFPCLERRAKPYVRAANVSAGRPRRARDRSGPRRARRPWR